MRKKQMLALLKSPAAWLTLVFVLLLAVLLLSVKRFNLNKGLARNAQTVGETIGSVPGQAVGMAVGSYEGWEAGKQEAAEHPDVQAEMKTRLQAVGKLDVLNISAKEDNFTTGMDFAKYQIVVVDAVYTIDLQKAVFSEEADRILVTLPQPEAETYFNESKTKTVFEKAASFWKNGSAEYGWESGINERKKLREETEQKFRTDAELMAQAREAGEREVAAFVSSIRMDSSKPVEIAYAEAGVG